MLYTFDLYAVTNNQGLLNAIKNHIPDLNHPSVFTDNSNIVEDITDDGNQYIFAEIKYHQESDRENLFNSIKGLAGIISNCLEDSRVRKIKDYDDESALNRKPSEIELEEYA